MRKALFALLALGGLAAVSSTPAEAWGGCGIHMHPTPWGCRWNGGWGYGGPVVVVRHGWGYGGWHHRYWHRHW